MQPVLIQDHPVGPGHPCLIIAEAGLNHDGDVERGRKLIDLAREAGADIVKFQAFRTDLLVTSASTRVEYRLEASAPEADRADMLRSLELTEEEYAELKRHCDDVGITFMCTPYDRPSVDMLERLDVAAYKVASTDTTNIPFLRYLASKGRPVILSSGMTTLDELDSAVATLREGGCFRRLVVLHCTSVYPAPKGESNLRLLASLAERYNLPIGFSDHTEGLEAPVLAVAAGACVIEKHFTLDKKAAGPDHSASLEPDELALLVERIREAEVILGDDAKVISPAEKANKRAMQKGLVARRPIRAGSTIAAEDVTTKRPAIGLPPAAIDWVVGAVAKVDIRPDAPITEDAVRAVQILDRPS